jgi:hypothetical protein
MNIPDRPEPISLDTLLSTSWRLLRENLRIVVPILLAFAPIAAVTIPYYAWFFFVEASQPRGTALNPSQLPNFWMLAFVWIVAVVLSVIGYMGAFAMADDLWMHGKGSVEVAMRRAVVAFGQTLLAVVILFALEIAAWAIALVAFRLAAFVMPATGLAVLAIPVFIVAIFLAAVFLFYVAPAVIAGRTAVGAIAESVRLARRWFGQSAFVVVILFAIQIGIGLASFLVNTLFSSLMGLGSPETGFQITPATILVGALGLVFWVAVGLATTAFYVLVIVGMYRSLRGLAEQPDAVPPTVVPPAGAEA